MSKIGIQALIGSPELPASLEGAKINIQSETTLTSVDYGQEPGFTQYTATVNVESHAENSGWTELQGAGLESTTVGDELLVTIFSIQGWLIDLRQIEDAWETMDAIHQDLADFSTLLDGPDGDLASDIDAESAFPTLNLLDRAILAPAWRTHGVGRALLVYLLPMIGGNIFATHPAPAIRLGDFDDATAVRKLRNVYQSIGFRPHGDGEIWIAQYGDLVDDA